MFHFARIPLILFLATIAFALEAGAVEPKLPPEPKIPLGKDTTYVDGPLDDEGFIDYAEALNEHYGRGVTPENNAHAAFWKVIGPGPVDAKIRTKYFRRLGIDMPPEKEDYFVTFESFSKTWKWETDPTPKDQLTSACSRPWTAQEFPGVAAWLKAAERPLRLMDDVLKRPEYFRPVVVPAAPQGPGSLIEAPLPGIQEVFDVARALSARAMLRTAEGNRAEAWKDLIKSHQLGRLAARGPFLIDLLVGYSIDNLVAAADIRYVAHGKWTVEAASAHAADLDRLPAMPRLAEKLDLAERFQYLDMVGQYRRGGLVAMQRLAGADRPDNPAIFQELMASADYRPALRNGNRWYDRLVAAARTKEPAKRNAEFEQINVELKTLIPTRGLARAAFWIGLLAGTPPTRGERIGDVVASLVLPTLPTTGKLEDCSVQRVHNVKVAFALAARHADAGRYPVKLDELIPKYSAEMPKDLFSEKPPIYRTVDGGYLLYSIGPDGEDDDGRSYAENREEGFGADDVVIRMPIPPAADENK
jgi:hypothetical protein